MLLVTWTNVIELDIVDAEGKYFGHDTAEISEVSEVISFTSQDFRYFDYGAVLGTVSAGFNYDTLAFSQYGGSLIDCGNKTDGNTVTLDDEIYYDVNTQGFGRAAVYSPSTT